MTSTDHVLLNPATTSDDAAAMPMPDAPADPPAVGPERLRSLLEQMTAVTVLDVRPTEERAEWFIPGSVHVDAYEALRAGDTSALAELELPKGVPVVTVCAKGRTSAIATRALRDRGIEAYSLAGGMKAWSLAWNTADLSAQNASLMQVRRTGKG